MTFYNTSFVFSLSFSSRTEVVVLITTVYRLKYETENNELLKFFMLRNERKEPSMTYLKRSLYTTQQQQLEISIIEIWFSNVE